MAADNKNISTEDIDCSSAEFEALEETDAADLIASSKAIANRERLETAIASQKNIWGYSSIGIEARKAAMTMLSTKTGMYSKVPLICKAENCPYCDSCVLLPNGLAPMGEPCPMETAKIEIALRKYIDELDIREDDYTDQNILGEIINLEIMIERCKALMAKEQNPIIEVVTGIGEDGTTYTHPEVSKAFEMYERCQKQHTSLLSLMNATRKDKKGMNVTSGNILSDIMGKISDVEKNGGFVDPKRPEYIVLDNETESQ